jgi:peptidoglycan/LPS O-acetylase OafA/YrhL
MSRYETSRLAFIDSLRLIAALLVVFQHLAERHRESSVSIIVELGPGIMGVVLFFLVSGYVIPFSVRAGLDIPSFLVRRLCRIYPLFLVAVAVVAIGGWTGWLENWSSLRDATPIRWAANLLLVQDFVHQPAILGVSWTLIIELIWYALFAGSLRFFGERSAQILSIFVPVSLVLLAFASLAIDSRIPLGRPAMIYAAVLGYQVFRFHTGLTSARSLMANVGVFLVVTSFTNWVAFGAFRHPHITLYQALGPWTLAPILFLVMVLPKRVREMRLFSRGWVPLTGAVSYSIYLLHPIANAAAEQYAPPEGQVAVALILTLIMSTIGYNFVEKPGISLGRVIAKKVANQSHNHVAALS